MDINMTDIGNRIKNRRKQLGLTQTDIHRECGIASGALSQMENGSRTPSAITLHKLSTALECSMDWLVTGFSMNPNNTELTEEEEFALIIMRDLPPDDREELYAILHLKFCKLQKARGVEVKSSSFIEDIEIGRVG